MKAEPLWFQTLLHCLFFFNLKILFFIFTMLIPNKMKFNVKKKT